MKKDLLSVQSIMDSIVPISRFNKGEANKIFDELNETESGCKVVLKNNLPACVLVQPEQYEAMVEALEDYALYFEAKKRIEQDEKVFTFQEVLNDLEVSSSDLEQIEVEIESWNG